MYTAYTYIRMYYWLWPTLVMVRLRWLWSALAAWNDYGQPLQHELTTVSPCSIKWLRSALAAWTDWFILTSFVIQYKAGSDLLRSMKWPTHLYMLDDSTQSRKWLSMQHEVTTVWRISDRPVLSRLDDWRDPISVNLISRCPCLEKLLHCDGK